MKPLRYLCSITFVSIFCGYAFSAELVFNDKSSSGAGHREQASRPELSGQSANSHRDAQEALEFELAQKSDTVSAYEAFLERYLGGRFDKQVRERLEFLYYRNATEANSIVAYEDYLRRFVGGVWGMPALKRLEDLMFKHAMRENTASSYEAYLARFDSDDFRKRASEDVAVMMLVRDRITQVQVLLQAAFYADAVRAGTIESYTAFLERYPEGDMAADAVYGLGALLPAESPPQVAVYIAQLYSPDLEVRANAARGLQNLRNLAKPAIPSLVKLLGDRRRLLDNTLPEKNTEVILISNLAAEALVGIGPASAPALLEALGNREPLVRSNAAKALGLLKTERAVDPLIEALQHDEDPETRRSVALALGRISDNRAVEPLIAALDDEDIGVTVNAIHALVLFKDPRCIEPLINVLKTNNMWVVENAVLGLMEFDVLRVQQTLLQASVAEQSQIRQNLIHINEIAMHKKELRWRQWWARLDVSVMQTNAD